MEFYYAVFRQTEKQITIYFPDLGLSEISAKTWEEAFDNSVDALAEWLANTEIKYVTEPSSYEQIQKSLHDSGQIVPIPVDCKAQKSYQKTKKFSVVFPEVILNQVDEFRESRGMKRSALLLESVTQYIKREEKKLARKKQVKN